ncbi:glucokinase regulatory protein-like [Patiria miniata]|uniref:SIS domain-containing protein n=1 Tax=Patiria miniata TaxID=46514 RepID=A0A914A114_PATMI|nr:glucokinase regulatory protein-like [Patiria miniata]XP_038057343.1 glucokinase regulatory protein-like [Patiria miniata]XP_038057344.1 glucokinase regulatory protein-like [Patiria miniata]XP_038057345.1 glucokinase regulatory protein-like [Patiria miniata]
MTDSEIKIPITETSNPLTVDIDISSSYDLVGLLHQCDSEIFEGWDSYKSNNIFSDDLIFNLQRVSEKVVDILQKRNPACESVVFSGCGTSGRIGFLTSKSINNLLRNIDYKPCCEYIIAGDDKALLTSQESPEDSPQAGVKALQQICKKKKKVLYIGISCGLSAPFVAGQLLYCMEHLDIFTPVLVGFNPVEQARNNPIEGWNETFLSVVTKLSDVQSAGNGFIINPILGPEAITGSSRMKGGTATKLLLEIIMLNALRQLSSSMELGFVPDEDASHYLTADGAIRCNHLMHMYETVCKETYPQALSGGLHEVIDWAGTSLNAGRHVYYIGIDNIGVLGLVDASECPPTFGADVNDVRGFLFGGYTALENREGDLVIKSCPPVQEIIPIEDTMRRSYRDHQGSELEIGANYFVGTILHSLTPQDTVIFLTSSCSELNPAMKMMVQIVRGKCHQVVVFVCYRDANDTHEDIMPQFFSKIVRIRIPVTPYIRSFMEEEGKKPSWFDLLGVHAARRFAAELSCKLLLNAVSTGAHIQKGKVYKNLMVDLKLSNSKLFQRGIEIVKSLVMCSEDTARASVLRSLYGTNVVSEELKKMPVSEHTRIGSFKTKVIPTSLILASKGCLIHEAMEILLKFPVIRAALAQLWSVSNKTMAHFST